MRDDAQPAQAQQVGAAAGLGVDLLAQCRSAGLQQRPPSLPRVEDIAASRIAPQDRLRDALHQLQRDVARQAVGHDHVGTPADEVSALDVADELEGVDPAACALAQLGARLERSASVPRAASSPLESSPTRGRSTPRTILRERRAHEGELDEVLAAGLSVCADIEQRHRMARNGQRDARAPDGRCRGRA